MRKKVIGALLSLAVLTPAALPSAAFAQQDYRDRHDDHRDYRGDYRNGNYGWQGDYDDPNWDPSRHYNDGRYGERRLSRDDRIYRGSDGRYYCRRSNGSTGLVIGAIGGGLVGGAIGGNTLGALLGAGGGALLGRSIDRGKVRCR